MSNTPKKFKISTGWFGAGRTCEIIGEKKEVNGRDWVPVIFDDEEDPSWFKPEALEVIPEPVSPSLPESEKSDWEVVAVIDPRRGNLNVEKGSDFKYVPGEPILTVRRLSDGELFTVGDEVAWDLEKLPGHSKAPFKIISFEINTLLPIKRVFCNNANICTDYLVKAQPTSQSLPVEQKIDVSIEYAHFIDDRGNRIYTIRVANKDWIPDVQFKEVKEAIEKIINPSSEQSEVKEEKKEEYNGCNVCGGKLVIIRGKYPGHDKREVCPTCTYERLEEINEISSKHYGQTSQEKNTQ